MGRIHIKTSAPRPRRLSARVLAVGALVGLAAVLAGAPAPAKHPNALWRVVHGLCLRDMKLSGHPEPCLAVNRARGFAVVPDLRSRTQVLLVPTRRLSGIESPELLAPDAENYWQAAWESRRYFEKRVGRPVPRDQIALAINSAFSRSQDQLHIHIDCVQSNVREVLTARQAEIGYGWAPLPFRLLGQRFIARRLDGADLGARDPFKLLANGDPDARADMAAETLILVGMVFSDGAPGFILLGDRLDQAGRDPAFGERLLDHRCAVLREP